MKRTRPLPAWSRWEPDFEGFYRGCREDIAAGKEYRGYRVPGMPENTFCVSCLPWIKYSALDINLCGDGLFLAPMISWGKAELDGGRMRMPLSFEIHHGAADGFHIARFYDEVEQDGVSVGLGREECLLLTADDIATKREKRTGKDDPVRFFQNTACTERENEKTGVSCFGSSVQRRRTLNSSKIRPWPAEVQAQRDTRGQCEYSDPLGRCHRGRWPLRWS